MKLLLASIVIFAGVAYVAGQRQGYEEKCESGKTSDGRELDTCDSGKFLACKDTRCACKDPGNQIYTYKNIRVNARNKRSPKKGGGGGSKSKGGGIGRPLLAGAAGGLAGGYIGSKLAQGGNSGSYNNGGSSGSYNNGDSNTRYSSSNSGNYQRSYQCYSRVEGTCILDRYRAAGGFIVNQPGAPAPISAVTTSSTTEAPSSAVTDANATTTTTTTAAPAPVAAAQVAFDILAVPECVENAECLTPEVKIVNGSVVGNVPSDPRLGVCVCQKGYAKDGRGLCAKVSTRSSSPATSIPALSTLLICIFFTRSIIL